MQANTDSNILGDEQSRKLLSVSGHCDAASSGGFQTWSHLHPSVACIVVIALSNRSAISQVLAHGNSKSYP